MKIVDTDWGLAYARGNLKDGVIEINKRLKKYPELMASVIEHEKQHLKYTSLKDTILIDILDILDLKKQSMLMEFMVKNPKVFFQITLPFWFDKKTFNYNPFTIIFWVFGLIFGVLLAFLLYYL